MNDSAFKINGPARLQGKVVVEGAKNSALKLMAAALLAEGTTTLHNVPRIADVDIMMELLKSLGCEVSANENTIEIKEIGRAHV